VTVGPNERLLSSPWISPFLRGKHAWERGERSAAVGYLEEILAEPHGLPVLYLPPHLLDEHAAMTFELFVAVLVTDRFLLIPFAPAIGRLWSALPAQYILLCMDQRQAFEGDLDDAALEIVYDAAENGLLSSDRADYDRVAKVLFRPMDYQHLAARLDLARLETLRRSAATRGAWEAYVDTHGELVANVFMYTVFHRGRVMHVATVQDVLRRIRETQPKAVEVTVRTLKQWIGAGVDLSDVARVGIGNAAASADCIVDLVAVLEGADFSAFAAACLA
jgi:hypothetical protein